MRFTDLNTLEQKVHAGNNGEYQLRKISIPVPWEQLTLEGYLTIPTHTDEQMNSLIILLRYLTAEFNIPREFMPEANGMKQQMMF